MSAFIGVRNQGRAIGILCRDGTADSFGADEWPMWVRAGAKLDLEMLGANDNGLNFIPVAEFRWVG